jgi:hypothetical protein
MVASGYVELQFRVYNHQQKKEHRVIAMPFVASVPAASQLRSATTVKTKFDTKSSCRNA